MLSLPFSTAIHSTPPPSLRVHSGLRRGLFPLLAPRSIRALSGPSDGPEDPHPTGLAGFRLEEVVEKGSERLRLDAWISSRVPDVSRARVQSSIRQGLVSVNGIAVNKASHKVKSGDKVNCVIAELQPLRAVPEDIPLDKVYEDSHVLVVNKPAHMVVHPAPGNTNGTLVNAILHHCGLPATVCADDDMISETEDLDSSDLDLDNIFAFRSDCSEASVRPGIVHRLDKGTSGLLVVAKNEHAHAHLAEQFKNHSIHRVYISLTSGVPSSSSARVNVPIARDPNNRLRMAAVSGLNNCSRTCHAVSFLSISECLIMVVGVDLELIQVPRSDFEEQRVIKVLRQHGVHTHILMACSSYIFMENTDSDQQKWYRVLEVLAGGGSALVEWRLETGRTHQIRVHAKYLGIPLLGDEVYGGSKSLALSLLKPRTHPMHHSCLSHILSNLQRPCLHALALGFKHPHTGKDVKFSCHPPHDFAAVLNQLRNVSSGKLCKS